MEMLEKCFLTEKYTFYLPKNNLFFTTFIKTILTEISPGIVFKLPFKVFFLKFYV
jgi:hypothetical protein